MSTYYHKCQHIVKTNAQFSLTPSPHELSVPRIALIHTWTSTQNEGWFRLALEETGVPYTYISDTVVRATPNLREKLDVILFPPTFSDVRGLLAGFPKRTLPDGSDAGPIPWQKSEVTPNWGGIDESPDIRGGLGFEGVAHLKQFVEDGGLFIPVASSTRLPVELGLADSVTITQTKQLQARGSIFRAKVEDSKSPITYGYDDTVGVYFNQSPVFNISVSGDNSSAEEAARPSGRGSTTDPDIPQGRTWTTPDPPPDRTRAEKELYVDPQFRVFYSSALPPPALYPRVVLRFADEKNLWISGMLAGGSELAGAPAHHRCASRPRPRCAFCQQSHVASGDARQLYAPAQRCAQLRSLGCRPKDACASNAEMSGSALLTCLPQRQI